MATNDLVLHFQRPADNPDADLRTFQVRQIVEGSTDSIDMYKFHHPVTGSASGVTSIQRKNTTTQRWENAGQIEWASDSNASVYFGIERISCRELRRAKKASSKSRRFKAAGAEYKWKIAENDADLFCVSTRGKIVATWTQAEETLRVADRAEGFLDRVVVTCFLNIWMKQLNIW
ncbi:hypothetical protein B0H21DRAFT_190956 [Amylocystis lapponica]|nr:hypothetical protein B0H21DRAFT_190956 [Amylocystis lapponica]